MIFFSICAVFAVLALLAIAKELNKTREALEVTQTSLEDIAQTLDDSIAGKLNRTCEALEAIAQILDYMDTNKSQE